MKRHRIVRLIAGLVLVVATATVPALAVDYYFTLDAPASLPGAGLVLPGSVVHFNSTTGAYDVSFSLPAGTPIAGLQRMTGGDWLMSFEAPVELGGTLWLPQDVVRYSPGSGSFACFLRGTALGISIATGIDGLLLPGGDTGPLVLSFNSPTTLAGVAYRPADLVSATPTGTPCTGWTPGGLFLNSSATTPPIPFAPDVSAVDAIPGSTIVAFDAPAALGSTLFLPGDLVGWSGTAFSLLQRPPGWPAGAGMNDVSIDLATLPPSLTQTVRYFRGTCSAGTVGAPCNVNAECGGGGTCAVTTGTADDVTTLSWSPVGANPVDIYKGPVFTSNRGGLSGPSWILNVTSCFVSNFSSGPIALTQTQDPNPGVGAGVYYVIAQDGGPSGAPNSDSVGCANPALCNNAGWCELGTNAGGPCNASADCSGGGTCRSDRSFCRKDTGAGDLGGCARHNVCAGGSQAGRLCLLNTDCPGSTCITVADGTTTAGQVCLNVTTGGVDQNGCAAGLGANPRWITAKVAASVVAGCP